MRKELYERLIDELQKVEGIEHVDLWNSNVEFIEQESPWPRPAVFIEFPSIHWTPIARGKEYRATDAMVRLHVVVDWQGSASANSKDREECLAVFDLCESIHRQLMGLQGETFQRLDLIQSDTTHNHEDIAEYIETYEVVGFKRL